MVIQLRHNSQVKVILQAFRFYDEILTKEQTVKCRRSTKEVIDIAKKSFDWAALRDRATETLKADRSITLSTLEDAIVFYECIINYRDRLYYDLSNPKRRLGQISYEIPVITRVLDQLTRRFLNATIEQEQNNPAGFKSS